MMVTPWRALVGGGFACLAVLVPSTETDAAVVSRGAVVESVGKGSAAEQAGLQPGDLILSWSRDSAAGNPRPAAGRVETPLHLLVIETDQAPRGPVRLTGRRGSRAMSWRLTPLPWELKTRPRFEGAWLRLYEEAAARLAAKEVSEGAAGLRALAEQAQQARQPRTVAWCFLRVARTLEEARQRTETDAAYRQAVEAADALASPLVSARIVMEAGQARHARGAYEEADERFRQAEGLAAGARASLLTSAVLASRANSALARGDAVAAEDFATRALALAEQQAPESFRVAQMVYNLGTVARQRGRLDEAEARQRRALALFDRHAPDSLQQAAVLSTLGGLLRMRGDLTGAEELYLRALRIRERLAPDSIDMALSLTSLGILADTRGDLDAAHDYTERSLRLREKLNPGSFDHLLGITNMGGIALRRGDLVTAEGHFRAALAAQEKRAPRSQLTSSILTNLGLIARDRGDLTAAEDYHRRSMAIVEGVAPESLQLASQLSNLALLLMDRDEFDAAEAHLRRALSIEEKQAPDSAEVAGTLHNLATIASYRGQPEAAEPLYERALAIKERVAPGGPEVATTLINLGDLTHKRGELDRSELHYGRARAILTEAMPNSLLLTKALVGLGDVALGRGQPARAVEQYRSALDIRTQLTPASAEQAAAFDALGLAYRRAGRLDEAIRQFADALGALESQMVRLGGGQETRAGFAAGRVRYYHHCLDALVEAGRSEEAFSVLERSRARSLLALLAERDLLFADLPTEIARERTLVNADYDRTQARIGGLDHQKDAAQVAELLDRLRELRAKQDDITARIRQASPRLASLQYPQPLDFAAARAALDPGTALLAYSVSEDRTILFVIQPPEGVGRGLSTYSIPMGAKELRDKVESFRSLVQRQAPREVLDARAAELYDVVVRPAEAAVQSARRLLLSPDGPLHALPFAALVRGSGGGGRGRASYLVQWKPLHTVASATVYAELKKARREGSGPGTLVAFGDPRYPADPREQTEPMANPEVRSALSRGAALTPLPSSREEVESITRLFPGSARKHLGEEATEERAKALSTDARYVHFACHGFLSERFPLDSGLALTIPEKPAEGQENGLLQAWEIFERVKLDADLVVLSACETGLGKETGGEGLLGLVRAFHYAGARSVLASLWAVSDVSTADLMKRLYGHLRAGTSADEALRAAQLEMIQARASGRAAAFSHPYHWSAFQLSGAAR